MIIKARKKSGLGAFNWAYLLLPALLCVFWFYPRSISSDQRATDINVVCDAEEVVDGNFIFKDYVIGNGITQSDEKSYSGKYSSKIDKDIQYGMSLSLPAVASNFRYIVSIRRFTMFRNETAFAVAGNEGSNFQLQTSKATDIDQNGWELLKLEFNLPKDGSVKSLKIFPYSFSNEAVAYFDDLRIETVNLDSLDFEPLPRLHFYLDNKAVDKLEKKRNEALGLGILKSADDDWVKAKLSIDDEEVPAEVKLRLKGDWTDHLKGDYYSYRVQMPAERSWNRLQTFSLQDPKTRYYMHEWLYHKALERVDVITPRYGFVLLTENTKNQVLYAYEEHFDKQIAEYKDRREGVIVKFAEDYLWDQRIRNKDVHNDGAFRNALASAEVLPFKGKKTTNTPKLLEQFNYANKLMEAFRTQSAPVTEVFDVERLARYFAISDVFDANHGTIWHNMRFYYNPITRKLEPIGFDGYTEVGPFRFYDDLFFGEYRSSKSEAEGNLIYRYIFEDETFNRLYTEALLEYSSLTFLENLFTDYRAEIYGLESRIKSFVDQEYTFDLADLRKRARLIRNEIVPYSQTSLKVYREVDDAGKPSFWATNHHSLPLDVVGSSRNEGGDILPSDVTYLVSNQKWYPNTYTEINLPQGAKYACYKLPGLDSTFYTEIHNWQRPGSELKILYASSTDPKIPLPENAFTLQDKLITIRSGKHKLTSPIIIPAGYTLVVEAGAEIDFTKKSYLLSYSTMHCKGGKGDPVSFTSSDRSSQGVTVIQAKETSVLTYTTFSNLNTLEENEWQLTGAVTFYESDVASRVIVERVTLDQIGDKGISAGEQAYLTINEVSIANAQIGIASKDLSQVSISQISLKDCNQGFAAYRKKPEFGGGTITVKNYETENVNRITNADKESKITLP